MQTTSHTMTCAPVESTYSRQTSFVSHVGGGNGSQSSGSAARRRPCDAGSFAGSARASRTARNATQGQMLETGLTERVRSANTGITTTHATRSNATPTFIMEGFNHDH